MNQVSAEKRYKADPYIVTRQYRGTRNAEEVIAALVKAHA